MEQSLTHTSLHKINQGVPSIRPPVNINHINEMAHSASVNQLPLPALQYGPPPFLPNLTDYANFLKTVRTKNGLSMQ